MEKKNPTHVVIDELSKIGFVRFPDWDLSMSEAYRLERNGKVFRAHVCDVNPPVYVSLGVVVKEKEGIVDRWRDCVSKGSVLRKIEKEVAVPIEASQQPTHTETTKDLWVKEADIKEGDIVIRSPKIHGEDYDSLIDLLSAKNFNWEELEPTPQAENVDPPAAVEDEEEDFSLLELSHKHEPNDGMRRMAFRCGFRMGVKHAKQSTPPAKGIEPQPQSVEALAEQTDIHVKCDDAYDGDAGKDEGSELALWHRKDGGLLATIFFNDISAKAYRSPSYNFSFNPEQVNQIRAFLAGQSSNKTINS